VVNLSNEQESPHKLLNNASIRNEINTAREQFVNFGVVINESGIAILFSETNKQTNK